ncbi:MAG: hypothetical protein HKN21_13385, partial [Candidatus Eisenbacteria bacterium]|nr:hypothetical protein [Candidatus Eisenbacteria bacterium]
LWPDPNLGPAIPALKLMLKHDAAHKVKIAINGRETSALLFDNQVINLTKTVAVTTWRGLPLSEGDNLIVVQCFDENGEVQASTERTIHFASAPVRAELIKDRSVLTADGTTQPILAIRFLDKDGYPAREGVVGTYEIDAPYVAQQAIDDLQDRPVVGNNRGLRFVVGPDGIAWIRLQPTTQSGEVTLRLPFPQWEQEVRAWLQPAPRDWILVGFAEGTVGYNTLSENVETIPDRGGDGEIYEDGQVSFFAKGQIKGEWLLTVALNSDRKPSREQLFRQIDPNAYYSLYADRTVQQYDAQSTGPLYVKLERAQFYALFGDFQTGMTVTELSRYNRVFRGFKTEYASPSANITGFVTDTRQGFAKEEIRGDGVSGPYALSANNLVLNSEHVYIETRDRFRTEIVTSRSTLARHLDYTIDYQAGTLTFREPVFSRDADLNPIFIVVDYETYTTAEASLNYGVRGELGTSNQRIRAGATYVHEEGGTAEGDLIGADAEVFLRAATRLRAELAHSSRTRVEGKADALAYLGELEHQSAIASGRLYYREQEEGFGFGQQNLTEAASRKFGAEAKSELGSRFNLKGLAYRHRNLSTDANRDVIESDLELIQEYVTLRSGFRFAQDKLEDGSLQISRQVTTGANSSLWKGRVDLRLQHDQSLDGANANQAYPTRTLFGASLKLTDDWKLFGEEELTHGDSGNTTISRVGLEAKPWAGSTVTSSVERQPGDAGSRLRSNFGLKQSLQLSEHWLVDGGLEHSNTTLTGSGDAIFPNAPSPSGSGQDFVAFFGGGAYQDVYWSASGRLEFRFTDSDDRVFVNLGATGEPKPGLGLGFSGRLSFASGSNGNKRSEHALRLALAHRPREHNWTILDKLELHTLKETGTATDSESWRVVNNFGSNWRFGRGQVSAQYGSKYARYELVGQDLSGYTDLLGAELRHDLSDIFDIGLRGQSLHGYKSGTMDYSAGVSLGMNVLENSWVSLGYNLLGFHDEDFSRASYTAQGPFLTFRLKFDQATVRSLVGGDQ